MKVLVLGDTHGRTAWKEIIKKENPDKVIFIGDYFDTHEGIPASTQISNFREIIQYKKSRGSEVVLLIGNHDYHYFPEIGDNGTSGYQRKAAPAISHLINESREYLQMAHKMDDFLFTHAGVSKTFLQRARTLHPHQGLDYDILLNELFIYKPGSFNFYGSNSYGDDITQTCIWIRPASLMKDNKDNLNKQIIQVAGHTTMNWIDIKGKSTGGRYYFIDTLGTSAEYLLIEDNKVSAGKLLAEQM